MIKTRTTLVDELNIRIILRARAERPAEQAAIENALGGLELRVWDRPYEALSMEELLRQIELGRFLGEAGG